MFITTVWYLLDITPSLACATTKPSSNSRSSADEIDRCLRKTNSTAVTHAGMGFTEPLLDTATLRYLYVHN